MTTNTHVKREALFLKLLWAYIAVKTNCSVRPNLGAIEVRHAGGGGYPGTLNVKDKLSHLPFPGGLTLAVDGKLRRGSGSGYVGWCDFYTVNAAIAFLKAHYVVRWCPIGGHIVSPAGHLGPVKVRGRGPAGVDEGFAFPGPPIDDEYWQRLKRHIEKHGDCQCIVFRGNGNVPIPESFREWCRERGIEIVVIDGEEYDRLYEPSAED
jgi:hypothetical protein